MNTNQYVSPPKKHHRHHTSSERMHKMGFRQRHITILVSLDVKVTFDAAWWPSILHNLKVLKCPKNLYVLARSYFRDRTATLHMNNIQIERNLSKGCPHVSCCGPGFWNIQYKSLLYPNYGRRTKAIAFADYLLIAVRAENVQEAVNFANRNKQKYHTG